MARGRTEWKAVVRGMLIGAFVGPTTFVALWLPSQGSPSPGSPGLSLLGFLIFAGCALVTYGGIAGVLMSGGIGWVLHRRIRSGMEAGPAVALAIVSGVGLGLLSVAITAVGTRKPNLFVEWWRFGVVTGVACAVMIAASLWRWRS